MPWLLSTLECKSLVKTELKIKHPDLNERSILYYICLCPLLLTKLQNPWDVPFELLRLAASFYGLSVFYWLWLQTSWGSGTCWQWSNIEATLCKLKYGLYIAQICDSDRVNHQHLQKEFLLNTIIVITEKQWEVRRVVANGFVINLASVVKRERE